MNLFFALHLHRHGLLQAGAAIGLAAMVALRLYAKPQRRVTVVLVLVPAVLAIAGFEYMMGRKRPRDGTAAIRRGLPFDSRGLFEVVHDMQKSDPTVQSFAIPRALLTHNLDAPRWADEALAHTVRPDWGISVDGVQTLPFGGVSMKKTVFCNEGGYWAVYDADEHGFNNPRGIWGAPPLDVAILGDSYSQGACVPPDKITAAFVRKKFPEDPDVRDVRERAAHGVRGLQGVRRRSRSRGSCSGSITTTTFRTWTSRCRAICSCRYVDDDGFKQNLAGRQGAIDKALDAYLDNVGCEGAGLAVRARERRAHAAVDAALPAGRRDARGALVRSPRSCGSTGSRRRSPRASSRRTSSPTSRSGTCSARC